jgi:hypothetical protein
LSGSLRIFQLQHADLPSEFPALKSLDALPNNLPNQVKSFVGREREVAQVKDLLLTSRLLTLTGAGGSGKSRLSIRVAAEVAEQYPDGLWFGAATRSERSLLEPFHFQENSQTQEQLLGPAALAVLVGPSGRPERQG